LSEVLGVEEFVTLDYDGLALASVIFAEDALTFTVSVGFEERHLYFAFDDDAQATENEDDQDQPALLHPQALSNDGPRTRFARAHFGRDANKALKVGRALRCAPLVAQIPAVQKLRRATECSPYLQGSARDPKDFQKILLLFSWMLLKNQRSVFGFSVSWFFEQVPLGRFYSSRPSFRSGEIVSE